MDISESVTNGQFDEENNQLMEYHIDDLPDEILEYILNLIPPYKCLKDCKFVCKRWSNSVQRVIDHKNAYFHKSILSGSLEWSKSLTTNHKYVSISNRHSHSTCTYGNNMYVFGGCTGTGTTFNDLWRFDLDTHKWNRPMPIGNYPSPKACATMVYYKHSFVLFGGWSYPSTYPPHQRRKLFKELHVYCIKNNRWNVINCSGEPPPTSAHSATVHGNTMIVFGGISSNYSSNNDVWCIDLDTYIWHKQATSNNKPQPRYGHSQIELDEKNLMIIGGCIGPNASMNDAWLLNMEGPIWTWKNVTMNQSEFAPTRIWCHQACKIGSHIIVLGEKKQTTRPKDMSISAKILYQPTAPLRINPAIPHFRRKQDIKIDKDENVNGKHGRFNDKSGPSKNISGHHSRSTIDNTIDQKWKNGLNEHHKNKMTNRQRQLESLRRMEERIQIKNTIQKLKKRRQDKFSIFCLNINSIFDDKCTANWIKYPEDSYISPEVRILYSLVLGKGELIVFGGIRKELMSVQEQTDDNDSEVYNEVLFIKPPKYSI